MVYFKSLLKKLISIYVSLFLIFSPLYGQTKQEATIYMTNGIMSKITLIRIGSENIELEMKNEDGELVKQTVLRSKVYKIILPSGTAILINPLNKAEFEYKGSTDGKKPYRAIETEFETKTKPGLLMSTQFSVVSWLINTSNGYRFEVSKVQIINDDSLRIASNGFDLYITIDSIRDIKYNRKITISKFMNRVKIGFFTGFAVGGFLGLITTPTAESSFETPSKEGWVIGFGLIGGFLGIIIGGMAGSVSGKDKILDMTGWSVAQKKDKIREIMNSE